MTRHAPAAAPSPKPEAAPERPTRADPSPSDRESAAPDPVAEREAAADRERAEAATRTRDVEFARAVERERRLRVEQALGQYGWACERRDAWETALAQARLDAEKAARLVDELEDALSDAEVDVHESGYTLARALPRSAFLIHD